MKSEHITISVIVLLLIGAAFIFIPATAPKQSLPIRSGKDGPTLPYEASEKKEEPMENDPFKNPETYQLLKFEPKTEIKLPPPQPKVQPQEEESEELPDIEVEGVGSDWAEN